MSKILMFFAVVGLSQVAHAAPHQITEAQARKAVANHLESDRRLGPPGEHWKVELSPSVLGKFDRSFIGYTGKGANYRAIGGTVGLLQYEGSTAPPIFFTPKK